jgi:hypothetical protein
MKHIKLFEKFYNDNLYEGIYDRSIGELTEFLATSIKKNIEKNIKNSIILETEYRFGKTWIEIEVELELDKSLRVAYDIKASADNELIEINIIINPLMFPKFFIELIPEIKGTLRHELEHVSQVKNKGNFPIRNKSITIAEYFMLNHEIDAFVREMHMKAKYYKKPISVIIDNFIGEYSDALTEKEIQNIKTSWISASKKLIR